MKSKLILASLLLFSIAIPSYLFAGACFPDGAGNMHCDDGRFLHGDGAGNLHGSDGSFYHRDGGGNYHGSDGSFMHGGGGAISGGNQYGGSGESRRAARAQARSRQCQSDCEAAYNNCLGQTSYCYDRCQARCLDEGRRCLNRCN